METKERQQVQTFGRKKTAIAVALCRKGTGIIRVNNRPLELLEPEVLRFKAFEPVLLIGKQKFSTLDIKVRVRGGGQVSQVYAVRQAIARAIVAFYQKYVDEAMKREIKDALVGYDRSLLTSDPRKAEAKKYGGVGARAKKQKSYR